MLCIFAGGMLVARGLHRSVSIFDQVACVVSQLQTHMSRYLAASPQLKFDLDILGYDDQPGLIGLHLLSSSTSLLALHRLRASKDLETIEKSCTQNRLSICNRSMPW